MKLLTLLTTLLLCQSLWAKSFVIFSMAQDLPMGVENEVVRKNYYINMGTGQGIRKDSVVDVFRIISVQNPYDAKSRVNYKVKIGELKIIHSMDNASIAMVNEYEKENTPIFEIPQFMIGDHVAVSVD
ncbi:hypothetical protein [Peredibacter starrii]|uniref:Uncharacterized protein n=1 Tax=Peredibacter starrii TaxID=28202 RepID=A0AAX4HQX0_9BACT|nr:hypothetical protein [Peredibacter starrii]WPU65562.1 hypothetical protein SOO65_02255 [Peredibacter starrii]